MSDASAAIMSAHGELLALVAKRIHYGNAVGSEGRLGIEVVVVGGIGSTGFGGTAIAAEVNEDAGEMGKELREDFVEDQVGLRVAVEEKEGRARAAGKSEDCGIGCGGDVDGLESWEQGRCGGWEGCGLRAGACHLG